MGTGVRSKIDSWRANKAAGENNGMGSAISAQKLAVLIGTEKQIAWAEDIRKNFLDLLSENVERTREKAQKRGSLRGYPKEDIETAANAVYEYYGLLFRKVNKASSIITARNNALNNHYAEASLDIALDKPKKYQKRIELMKKGEFNVNWLNLGWSIKE